MDLSLRKMFRLGGRAAPQRRPPRERKKDDDAERLLPLMIIAPMLHQGALK